MKVFFEIKKDNNNNILRFTHCVNLNKILKMLRTEYKRMKC